MGATAKAITAAGSFSRGISIAASPSVSQSFVRVSLSLGIAPISPGPKLAHVDDLPAGVLQELPDPLLDVPVRVQDMAVGMQDALVDAEHVDLAGVGVGARLEDVREQLVLVGGIEIQLADPQAPRA